MACNCKRRLSPGIITKRKQKEEEEKKKQEQNKNNKTPGYTLRVKYN